jgi:hypothetical protein
MQPTEHAPRPSLRRMRLVGDALHRSQVPIPVVGILPWGVVNKREELTALCRLFESTGKQANYKSTQCNAEGVGLNSGAPIDR